MPDKNDPLIAAPSPSHDANPRNEAGNGSLFSHREKKNPADKVAGWMIDRWRANGYMEVGIAIMVTGLIAYFLIPTPNVTVGEALLFTGFLIGFLGLLLRTIANVSIVRYLRKASEVDELMPGGQL